jgi:hypothetical protein
VRIFPPRFVRGVVELYRALEANDKARIAEAYAMWGFPKLTPGTTQAMTVWARFMRDPILDDRVRTAADGVKPSEYGRREIGQVMRALKAEGGALTVPREFVFLERATIGLGGAFLRLGAAQFSSDLRGRHRRLRRSGGRAPPGRSVRGCRPQPSRRAGRQHQAPIV